MIPISGRYQPMVRLDNGAGDGQSHAHAFRLAGVERLEDALLTCLPGMPGPRSDTDNSAKFSDARSPDADDAIFARRVLHRVDSVDHKVQNDLLKLDAVAEDRKRIRCDHANQFDLSSNGERRKKFDGFPRDVVEVETFQLEGRLCSAGSSSSG